MHLVRRTCTTLAQNQRDLASNVDLLTKELAKIDSRVLAIAFREGEWTLKVFRKEASWNSLSREAKIKEFDERLNNLHTRCRPGVEVIQPNRVGSYPFLKVTFISPGERNDFFQKNKGNIKKYTTSNLVPKSIAPKEREIKDNLKKEICTLLSEMGYRIQDKDVSFTPCLATRPNSIWGIKFFSTTCLVSLAPGIKPPPS